MRQPTKIEGVLSILAFGFATSTVYLFFLGQPETINTIQQEEPSSMPLMREASASEKELQDYLIRPITQDEIEKMKQQAKEGIERADKEIRKLENSHPDAEKFAPPPSSEEIHALNLQREKDLRQEERMRQLRKKVELQPMDLAQIKFDTGNGLISVFMRQNEYNPTGFSDVPIQPYDFDQIRHYLK